VAGQIGDRLAKCWSPPKPEPPQLIEVTLRLLDILVNVNIAFFKS
jgi:hypothetical protein